MKSRHFLFMAMLFSIIALLTGCVPGDGAKNAQDLAGFFSGVWHGWIAPISLILGLFSDNIRLYEVYNTGWWYDFGFYIAVISGFGGISLFRRKKRK
ncbi:hypothetical protein QPK24_06085 [Paenibacillus polygoni]|uniref:Lipoprotein n=1 Tax=Paenibacillus polygoni TaxID=3050112 RepID=A0ABY8X9W1_9BACL|nr:hypothetical protein [Paenibacillus polygoni]WIV20261.1 hypothetical protein QPK24_06085 [Paenibacillus polygoni]